LLHSSSAVHPVRLPLWVLGAGFGVVAEVVGRPQLILLDSGTGFTLLGLGLVASSLRKESWTGPLLGYAGVAWFAGTFGGWLVYLHRGVLAQLVLVFPGARLLPSSRLERAAIVAAYAYAVWYPFGGGDRATLAFAGLLAAVATLRWVHAHGVQRRACVSALAAAIVFSGVLVFTSLAHLVALGISESAVLAVYELGVCVVGGLICADVVLGRWAKAAVSGVVVDLGEGDSGSVTASLARSLGDPSLVVGYWLPERSIYVDEAGRRVELEARGRSVTRVEDGGSPLAVLIHDVGVLDDPELASGVQAAVRIAISNVRLQAEVQARAAQVEASRRRIVEAADEQRRQLTEELRDGAERRLARVAALVADNPELTDQLRAARTELRELAQGIHPASLVEGGLRVAVAELAARSPLRVELAATDARFEPTVEAAAYFVCAEALANAAKHASASQVSIEIGRQDGCLCVVVVDDGVGGADPAGGSGLRGLADRLEAVGGRLSVSGAAGSGTRVAGELPLEVGL
jgi:signal transduction histidine kinase